MNKEPLDLDPLLLLLSKVVRALPLLDLVVELVNDNRDEQVHNEESSEEDVDNIQQGDWGSVLVDADVIISNTIHCIEHHIWPHL